jgi:hypothetical protein
LHNKDIDIDSRAVYLVPITIIGAGILFAVINDLILVSLNAAMPSTVISSFIHIPESNILRVTFVTGSIYDYVNVPVEVYDAMKASFAKGIFFNENIKGKFKCVKVK